MAKLRLEKKAQKIEEKDPDAWEDWPSDKPDGTRHVKGRAARGKRLSSPLRILPAKRKDSCYQLVLRTNVTVTGSR